MDTEIWLSTGKLNIKPHQTLNSFRRFHSFCVSNGLPSGRFSKLQGGYYVLNDVNQWEFLAPTLKDITFQMVFDKLKSLTNPRTGEKY